MSILCSMVGATFGVAAAAEVIRLKKSVIANGNAQIDTAQSKFGGSSALFDGTSDYLTVPGGGFNFGTGDFTVEFWARHAAINDQQVYFDFRTSGSDNIIFYLTSGNKLEYYDGATTITGATNIAASTWYHIALTRSSGTLRCFINGTQEWSQTASRSHGGNGVNVIGSSYDFNSANSMNGWIDEFRISNTARYTANFTPSTTPFVNDNNTLLLIHADGTDATTYFEDDNGVIPVSTRTAKTVTAYGNAQINTSTVKFGTGSLLLDGSGDYIKTNSSSDYAFRTNNWTIECWIRTTNVNTAQSVFDFRNGGGDNNAPYLYLQSQNLYYGEDGANRITSGAYIVSTSVFYHIAIVRNGSTITMYIDGTSRGTYTTAKNHSTSYVPTIGDNSFGSAYWNGYIDEFRISNIARYTANFISSSTAFGNDPNTVLLLHMDGANTSTSFTDDTITPSRSSVSLVGINAPALSDAQSKFGNTSLACSSTANGQITFENKALNEIGQKPFTIELWFRTTNLTQSNKIFIFTAQSEANRRGFHITNQTLRYSIGGTDVITTGNHITSGTWHHLALVRGTDMTTHIYIDGTSRGSVAGDTQALSATNDSRIAGLAGGFTPDGHIDEFRISKVARYTQTFTPPTAPFVNDSDTTLLVHFDGTNGQTVFQDDNGYSQRVTKHVNYTNAIISTTQSKFNGSSVYFDGTGSDRLYFPSGSDVYMLPSGNAKTFECWVYINNLASMSRNSPNHLPALMGQMDTNGNINWAFGPNSAGGLTIYWWSGGNNWYHSNTTNLAINTWYHLALVMDGTSLKGYVNGTEYVSATIANTPTTNVPTFFIGTEYTTTINAYVDEFRISNSVRYTGNFTAPTTAFTNDANTVLLLHFNAANSSTVFEDDIGGRTRLNAQGVNNAQLSSAQSKFGGTSLLTDGVDDRVIVPYNNKLMFGTGDFTIEFWMRPIALTTGNDMMMDFRLNSGDNTIVIFTSNKVIRYYVGADRIIGSTLNNNQWYHIAVSRSSNSTKMFIDGTQVGSTYTDNHNLFVSTAGLWIGDAQPFAGQGEYNGYMDEIRISNSARYTANFTPPTEPFSNDANTVLLLHMDGTSGSTVFIDDNGQIPVSGA